MITLSSRYKSFAAGQSSFALRRNKNGVVQIRCERDLDLQTALGFAHAHDRMMQMLVCRIVSQGRITELLVDTDEAYYYDCLMRKMGFAAYAKEDVSRLNDQAKAQCQAYADGFNAYLKKYGTLALGNLIEFKPKKWEVADTLAVFQIHLYVGLAQIQENTERFIIQAIKDGVDLEKLKALFSPHLDALDSKLVSLIQKTPFEVPYLEKDLSFLKHFSPAFLGSNAWVVSSKKCVRGGPFVCFDPHLQINRLPPIWSEFTAQIQDDYQMGVTLPGLPGMMMGRTKSLSCGFTYGLMDQLDFFIEELKDGKVKRGKGWEEVTRRSETIQRKKKGAQTKIFLETGLGVLETEKNNGLCFCLSWANKKNGASTTFNALTSLWESKRVNEAQKKLKDVALTANWILADRKGNIGYQQSGLMPKRYGSGLLPLAASVEKHLWNGFVSSSKLKVKNNSHSGFFASANDAKNGQLGINLPFASYRFDRISELLQDEKRITLEKLQHMQCELFSLQAKRYLNYLTPLIPKTKVGAILTNWDCCYTGSSEGATLFEVFYHALLEELVGKKWLGEKPFAEIRDRKSLLAFIHGHCDNEFLSGNETLWFGKEGRKATMRRILKKSLSCFKADAIPPYSTKRLFNFANMLLDERFPKFLGFDYGPVILEGSRASILQAQIVTEKGRKVVAAPSWRFISNLKEDIAYTILPGGPSENRFSKYYTSEIEAWLSFKYKELFV